MPAPEPIQIQLAIQGGGARIVALMAALEALEARSDRIQVTRIVGTSAGAIAGALFASGVGIHNMAEDWRNGGLQTLLDTLVVKRHWYLPKALSLLLHLVKKKPLWDENKVQAFVDRMINGTPELDRVMDLHDLRKRRGIDLCAVHTNLHNRRSESSDGGAPVVLALSHSSGLPYLLRKWGCNPVIVDGGIGDNFPASRLDANLRNVTPVGLSFKPRVDQTRYPTTFQTFSLALLDVAIELSAEKSLALVPRTHFIDTTITTIDFDTALAVLRGRDYDTIKSKAGAFFDELEQQIRTQAEQNATAYSVLNLHPWRSENLVAQAVMSGVWDAVSRQFSDQPYHFHSVALRATLGGLEQQPPHQPQRPDRITTTIDFEPGPDPLYCYFMGVSDGVRSELTKSPTLTVQSLATGEFVPHVRVPAVSSKNTAIRYEVVFFTPALLQGNQYRLVQTEEGTNLLDQLLAQGHDQLGVDPKRVLGKVGRNRLIVDVPERVRHCVIQPQPGLRYQALVEYGPEACSAMDDVRTVPGYRTYMVEGKETDGLFAIDITIVV